MSRLFIAPIIYVACNSRIAFTKLCWPQETLLELPRSVARYTQNRQRLVDAVSSLLATEAAGPHTYDVGPAKRKRDEPTNKCYRYVTVDERFSVKYQTSSKQDDLTRPVFSTTVSVPVRRPSKLFNHRSFVSLLPNRL